MSFFTLSKCRTNTLYNSIGLLLVPTMSIDYYVLIKFSTCARACVSIMEYSTCKAQIKFTYYKTKSAISIPYFRVSCIFVIIGSKNKLTIFTCHSYTLVITKSMFKHFIMEIRNASDSFTKLYLYNSERCFNLASLFTVRYN